MFNDELRFYSAAVWLDFLCIFRFLHVAKPLVSPEDYTLTKQAVEEFRVNEGPKLQEHLQTKLVYISGYCNISIPVLHNTKTWQRFFLKYWESKQKNINFWWLDSLKWPFRQDIVTSRGFMMKYEDYLLLKTL